MRNQHSILSSSAGSALLGLIGVILIVALLAAGILGFFGMQLLQSTESTLSSKAFQAAESGVSLGKAYISTNLFWYTETLPHAITGTVGRTAFSTFITTNATGMARLASTGRQTPAEWTSIWEDTGEDYVGRGGRGKLVQGLLVYRDTSAPATRNIPRWRAYTRFREVCDEETALTAANQLSWQRLAAHPKTNEFLLVVQDSSRWISAQACTGYTWFAGTTLNSSAAPSQARRSFDVAYENLSGRGLIVYADNTANARYRTWNGTTWSAQQTIGVVTPGAAISWVRLVSQPQSDNILCLVRWRTGSGGGARNHSRAMMWNGASSTWNASVATLENTVNDDIDYEQLNGACSTNLAMVVYLNGASLLLPKYRTWNGVAWSGELSLPSALPARPRWIRVEFSADGTDAFAAFLDANTRLNGAHWTSTGGWGAYNNFGVANGVPLNTSTYRDFDIAWGIRTNALMVVYARSGATYRSYMFQPLGGAASYGTTPTVASLGQWMELRANPLLNEFVYAGLDSASDVGIQRWNGSEWSFISEVEASSSVQYNTIDFAFRNDITP